MQVAKRIEKKEIYIKSNRGRNLRRKYMKQSVSELVIENAKAVYKKINLTQKREESIKNKTI